MSILKKVYPALPVMMGAFVVGALTPTASINATENPFASAQLPSGYKVAADDTDKG